MEECTTLLFHHHTGTFILFSTVHVPIASYQPALGIKKDLVKLLSNHSSRSNV